MNAEVEWPGGHLTGRQELDNVLTQQGEVMCPAFRSFSPAEMDEFFAARPYITDLEQRRIARAESTRDLIFRVAEAVGRVRSEGKLDLAARPHTIQTIGSLRII